MISNIITDIFVCQQKVRRYRGSLSSPVFLLRLPRTPHAVVNFKPLKTQSKRQEFGEEISIYSAQGMRWKMPTNEACCVFSLAFIYSPKKFSLYAYLIHKSHIPIIYSQDYVSTRVHNIYEPSVLVQRSLVVFSGCLKTTYLQLIHIWALGYKIFWLVNFWTCAFIFKDEGFFIESQSSLL